MQITPGEYLETALKPIHGTGRSVEAKNAVRACVCYMQPSPASFNLHL